MAGLIEQQKMLISKLEKGRCTMKTEEKTKIMKLLKELTKSIERTKEDIKTSLAVAGTKSKGDVSLEEEENSSFNTFSLDSKRASGHRDGVVRKAAGRRRH